MGAGKVIVIGGGPAGMMAAGHAAQSGAQVVLLEKGHMLGRKLRISGKGRGNITNTAELQEFIEAFAPNGKFLYGAFSRYFREDLLTFLRKWGVQTKEERGGRVFPVSDRAGDVADAFERWMESVGVKIKLNTRVKSIDVENGRVVGVSVFGGQMNADAVVLATGGASYPKTGSTGDGYAMAREVGHSIIVPKPALSGLIVEEQWAKDLQGLSLRNVQATLYQGTEDQHRRIDSEFGEMIFTHFGISGPIILTLSRGVGELLKNGNVYISIDLKPALSKEQLHARLINDFKQVKIFKNYARELLPRMLAEMFPTLVKIDGDKPINTITVSERTAIVDLLKDLRVRVLNLGSLEEAIVTSGGVPVKEIDPKTMMSKIVDGLFLAGEVIDIDAITGGFNLQAAFSTGFVAGEAAAEFVVR